VKGGIWGGNREGGGARWRRMFGQDQKCKNIGINDVTDTKICGWKKWAGKGVR